MDKITDEMARKLTKAIDDIDIAEYTRIKATKEWALNLWKEAGLIEEPDYEKEAREYVKWVKLKHPRFDEVDRIECFTKAIALLFKAIEKLKKEK